jgi:predicted phosphodiesterase
MVGVMTGAPRRTPPRWVRWTLVCTGAVLACIVFGVTTASAHLSLGPHAATYEVTTTGIVTADLGPLGTLEIDSPAKPLGVDVTIGEIPADLTQISPSTTLAGLSSDLHSYLQFFGDPEVTLTEVVRALVVDAVRRTLAALLAVALAGLGFFFLLGRERRAELASWLAPRTWGVTAGVVALALVGGAVASDDVAPAGPTAPTSPVFAGTALEGARITGRLAGVIDTYGAQLVGIYRKNQDFYRQANTALQVAWHQRSVKEQEEREEATAAPSASPSVTPSPGASSLVGGDAEQAAEQAAPVTFLVISDLHCNMNMTPLIRNVAKWADVDVILDAGDTTLNGTAVEKVCVDSFASARPKGVEMVAADGNHDSELISAAERARGIIVLDGTVVDVKGVHILGDRDPHETRVGGGTTAVTEETTSDVGRRLAQVACEEGDVDLLLIHSPSVGDGPLYSGCVPFQVSGHTHLRYDPFVIGQGVRYVNGSTAGAAPSQPTVGPLHGTAEMTLLRFDPVTRAFTQWKLVEVRPDRTARVSAWKDIPPRPPQPVGTAPAGGAASSPSTLPEP